MIAIIISIAVICIVVGVLFLATEARGGSHFWEDED